MIFSFFGKYYQESDVVESLKRLELICNFCNTTQTIISSIKNIDKTNLNYIEPNRIIKFLDFNYLNKIYINNLGVKE